MTASSDPNPPKPEPNPEPRPEPRPLRAGLGLARLDLEIPQLDGSIPRWELPMERFLVGMPDCKPNPSPGLEPIEVELLVGVEVR